jgi:hypothetical protein
MGGSRPLPYLLLYYRYTPSEWHIAGNFGGPFDTLLYMLAMIMVLGTWRAGRTLRLTGASYWPSWQGWLPGSFSRHVTGVGLLVGTSLLGARRGRGST